MTACRTSSFPLSGLTARRSRCPHDRIPSTFAATGRRHHRTVGRMVARHRGIGDRSDRDHRAHERLPAELAGPHGAAAGLDRADRMTLRKLPVTTRTRAVLDCAGLRGAEDIRDRALQRGTTILSLETALGRMAPGTRTTAARRLIEPVRQGGVSPPERELRGGLTDRADSRRRCRVPVATNGRECWIDLAVEEIKLAVEVDGWTVHSRSDAFGSDRERQNQLVRAGWTVLRYAPQQECVRPAIIFLLDEAAVRRHERPSDAPARPRGVQSPTWCAPQRPS